MQFHLWCIHCCCCSTFDGKCNDDDDDDDDYDDDYDDDDDDDDADDNIDYDDDDDTAMFLMEMQPQQKSKVKIMLFSATVHPILQSICVNLMFCNQALGLNNLFV